MFFKFDLLRDLILLRYIFTTISPQLVFIGPPYGLSLVFPVGRDQDVVAKGEEGPGKKPWSPGLGVAEGPACR